MIKSIKILILFCSISLICAGDRRQGTYFILHHDDNKDNEVLNNFINGDKPTNIKMKGYKTLNENYFMALPYFESDKGNYYFSEGNDENEFLVYGIQVMNHGRSEDITSTVEMIDFKTTDLDIAAQIDKQPNPNSNKMIKYDMDDVITSNKLDLDDDFWPFEETAYFIPYLQFKDGKALAPIKAKSKTLKASANRNGWAPKAIIGLSHPIRVPNHSNPNI